MCSHAHPLLLFLSFTFTYYSDLSVYLFVHLRPRKVHSELLILNCKVTEVASY